MLADFIVATHSLTPAPASKGAVSRELGRVLPSSGHGYLAGEFPGGITSVDGVPTSATVRILYRPGEGEPGDGVVVATTQSGQDGTWRVEGLDTSKLFDVIGRADGFNDVIMSRISPISMVDITYAGAVAENETFTGAVGFLELVGGIPPYNATVVDQLPAGMFPVVNGRQLIIDGTTADDAVFNSTVRITASNGATKDIPISLLVGFKAPANFKAETVVVDDVFSVALTWEVTNSTQQIKVYRSATPFDLDDLPEPIAMLSGTSNTYTDDDVIKDDHFYYMVTAISEQYELRSNVIAEDVIEGDPHWNSVVALMHFDGDLVDETGDAWASIGSPPITDTNHLFDKNILFSGSGGQHATKTFVDALGTDDFTIEMFIRRAAHSDYRCIFDSRSIAKSGGIAIYTSSLLTGNVPVIWTNTQVLSGVSEIPHSEWVHIAVCRKSGTLYYFTGGILQNSANFTNDLTNKVVRLGTTNEGTQSYGGHIDELRITKGVARYTENFTPPTEPFPNK